MFDDHWLYLQQSKLIFGVFLFRYLNNNTEKYFLIVISRALPGICRSSYQYAICGLLRRRTCHCRQQTRLCRQITTNEAPKIMRTNISRVACCGCRRGCCEASTLYRKAQELFLWCPTVLGRRPWCDLVSMNAFTNRLSSITRYYGRP